MSEQSALTIVPLTLAAANEAVEHWHRHHGPFPPGLDYFRVGVVTESGELVGVAIVSRPPNRNSDDGLTCEVVRVATDGTPNACSALYGASARIARLMGFRRIITYTLTSESGISLRAAGWVCEKTGIKSYWHSHQVPGRTVKAREHYGERKQRWAVQLALDEGVIA